MSTAYTGDIGNKRGYTPFSFQSLLLLTFACVNNGFIFTVSLLVEALSQSIMRGWKSGGHDLTEYINL